MEKDEEEEKGDGEEEEEEEEEYEVGEVDKDCCTDANLPSGRRFP